MVSETAYDKTEHDCRVSFKPKRYSSDFLLVEETLQRKSLWYWCRRNEILTPDMLKNIIQDILRYCLTHRIDSYRIHMDRLKGARLIKKVAYRTNYNDLTMIQIVGIVWSSLSVVHHFHIMMKPLGGYRTWRRRREYNFALYAYEKVLLMLVPHMFNTVIQALVTFCNEAKLWQLDTLVTLFIKKILDIYKDNDQVVTNLLDIVQGNENVSEVRNILRVLDNLLKVINWLDIDGWVLFRLLELYKQSILDEEYACLNSMYEACVRHTFKNMGRKQILKGIQIMISWVSEMNVESIKIFGNLLEFVSSIKNRATFDVSITSEILQSVLELVESSDVYISLLGCRILIMMLDRNSNNKVLMIPRIFYKEIISGLNFGTCDDHDRRFIQSFHNLFHTSIISAVVNHGTIKVNLECIFAILATLTVEVQCGYTAASVVCLLMTIQEYALNQEGELAVEQSNRIHACIMYVMSLVCFIHKAEVFYNYVYSVMARRAQLAPQLNPTSRIYEEASSVVHLKKAELYFEDWEARYGLWKCFISDKPQ